MLATPRVWGGNGPGDSTAGLIELCEEWVGPQDEVAEVGCFAGVSTRVFACFARKVYAVDAWGKDASYTETPCGMVSEADERFKAMLKDYPNVVRIHELSTIAAYQFCDLDAVYLDAAHHEAAFCADVRAWLPTLRPRGLLMGHDFDQVGRFFPALGLPAPVKVYSETSWVVRREDIR